MLIDRFQAENKRVLIFCDIEGAEEYLLNIDTCKELENIDIILESHDHLVSGITEDIISRFQKTHVIDIVEDRPRDANKYQVLNGLPASIQYAILKEDRRTSDMKWLRLSSKNIH